MTFGRTFALLPLMTLLPCETIPARELPAVVASIREQDLAEFDAQPDPVKKLIRQSLELTRENLAYTYGSDSPARGGMDCSGTICHLLKTQNIQDAPRMAHTTYLWLESAGNLRKLSRVHDPAHPDLQRLRPGDLLFWEGTYKVKDRNPPISHVMLYLGSLKSDGRGVLFGASSGRYFRGKRIHGVSVFDFSVPGEKSTSKLVGYGPVPGLRDLREAATPRQEKVQKVASRKRAPLTDFLKNRLNKNNAGPSVRN